MDVNSLFNVKGKVVLVTGGAKGIGRMISEGFVANGAKVYISSRDGKACEKAAAELTALGQQSGGSAIALPADLQSLEACKSLAAELTRREGDREGLHILINNSGAAWGDSFDTHPDHAWTKLLTLNLQRVFTLTQLLAPLLEKASKRGGGGGDDDPARVINIGSIDAIRVPTIENYAYSASKAGLHQLTRTSAVALGPRGITVNTLACGPFPSKMMKAVLDSAGKELAEANPLGRIGTPEDAAGACLFLSGRAGAFVNGATLTLDGGIHLLSRL
ncbi:NAD(P)-binding protein [Cryphonectria parasitica EP155]|uniref:NAD(P)-binding protein n=1 Tax=Cryphonectria parasitica (strain ATCC 38755 / EP155) TaxID=660469 RepID=A0A9P4XU79_CRYP1|nr:NAD(P)-binding protein [Cryphonectria parasitica EP155]KAF3761099.1 NAD(P)-binding protein [Cryphonectria parasitica EP155]